MISDFIDCQIDIYDVQNRAPDLQSEETDIDNTDTVISTWTGHAFLGASQQAKDLAAVESDHSNDHAFTSFRRE